MSVRHPPITDAGFGDGTPAPGESPLALLRSLATRLDRIERSEERRAGAEAFRSRLLAAFGSLITAGALALGGWVWSVQGDVGDLGHATNRNAERLEEHRRQGGPMGHPESVIARTAVNEGRISALESTARSTESRLNGIEAKLDEVLERLPRRGR